MNTQVQALCRDDEDLRHEGSDAALRGLSEDLQFATQRLIEQEKMATLGGLVAGITHEINTPIGIAVTAASGMEEFARSMRNKLSGEKVSRSELLGLASQLQTAAVLVSDNLARAAVLIGNFKTLAIDQVSEAEVSVELVEYLDGIVHTHQPVLRAAQTRVEVQATPPLQVRLSVGMFSQIVSNLIVNALTHAFEDIEKPCICIKLWAEGDRVLLRFSDNGKGASADVRSRMFEPFFTTRRGSGGSGLGLHIVSNLAQRLGGKISVEEADGSCGPGGLSFLLELPLRQKE